MDALTRKMVNEARSGKPQLSKAEVGTMLGGAVMRHIALDRVKKVDIVERDGKFWGNVVFDMPPGLPDMLGTPEAMPRPSRTEALGDAKAILDLTRMAETMRMPGEAEVTTLIFDLDKVAVEIPQSLFLAAAPRDGDAEDPRAVLLVLDQMVEIAAGGGPLDKEAVDAAGERTRGALIFAMARALHHGIFRHRTPAMEREMALTLEDGDGGPQPG